MGQCAHDASAGLLEHRTEGGTTYVRAGEHGLGNGRWRGEHRLETGVDDTYDTVLDLDADHGDLSLDLEIDDTGRAGALDLASGERRRCFASFDEYPRGTIMGSATDSIAVWHPRPHRFVTRGQVDCRPGSEWKVLVEVGFDGWGLAARPDRMCATGSGSSGSSGRSGPAIPPGLRWSSPTAAATSTRVPSAGSPGAPRAQPADALRHALRHGLRHALRENEFSAPTGR